MTIFVTTHYMDEAEHCDRIALIYAGKLIALGSPHDLKEQYTAGTLLEVEAHPLMTALKVLDAVPEARDVAIFGVSLHVVTRSEEDIAPIRQALDHAGITVDRIEPIVPSLEDVFVGLIEQADREREG
jgi:ABC-2 type transport system ATP-binding protein